MAQVDQAFAEILEEWFGALDDEGIQITVTSGHRSSQQQARLFSGRLGRAHLAAPPGRSFHEVGLALDFVTRPRTSSLMRRAGELAEALGLRWGGRFRPPDEVHIDAAHFISLDEAKADGFPHSLVEVS